MIIKKEQNVIIDFENMVDGYIINDYEKKYFDEEIGYYGDMSWSIEGLVNIVKNCIEYTPLNGTIKMSYVDNPIYTSIIISDSGKGIDKKDIPNVFKRFYKGKNSKKESVGIGLSLSKIIFEKQCGIISVRNQNNGGALFEIKFYKSF